MNLLEEEVGRNGDSNNKKVIKISLVAIVFLSILAVVIFAYANSLKAKQFKFYLDGDPKSVSAGVFKFDNDEMLISISDFAQIIGYEYKKGKYKAYDEDKNKCHVLSQNREEVAGMEVNSNKVYKISLADNSTEYFTLSEEIKQIDGKLYTNSEGVNIIFNTIFQYDSKTNKAVAYTLDKIVSSYIPNNKDSNIKAEEISYENKKAMKYGYILVKNSAGEYGVKDVNKGDKDKDTMAIETQYSSVKFLESTKEFIITTPEKKQGIRSAVTKQLYIKPEYDEIKQLDVDNDLYIVKNNDKYGVINKNSGGYIIYAEYDSIGVNVENFDRDEISNQYILYDNCIPVKKIVEKTSGEDKVTKVEQWTLFDKLGNKISPNYFDGIGYIKGTSKTSRGSNLLLIPEVEGIVVYKDAKYGIIDSVGRELIPISLNSVYSITNEGKENYYMVYGNDNKVENILEFLDKAKNTQSTNKNNNTNANTNTNNNTNANNATTNNNNKNTVVNNTNGASNSNGSATGNSNQTSNSNQVGNNTVTKNNNATGNSTAVSNNTTTGNNGATSNSTVTSNNN